MQNFRAIVLGLRDSDERVRRVAGDVIVDCFELKDVLKEFGGASYSMGLVCNLREVLETCTRCDLRNFMSQLLLSLEGKVKVNEVEV